MKTIKSKISSISIMSSVLFASAVAFADGTINLSSDPATPTNWSDSSAWGGGSIINDIAAEVRAKTTGSVAYLNIDDNYSVKNLVFNSESEYHIDVAEGKLFTLAASYNALFFTSGSATIAKVFLDSGAFKTNTAAAIYLPKSGDVVEFGADTTLSAYGSLKIRSVFGDDASKYVKLAGTVTTGTFEVYGNTATNSSTSTFVTGTVNAGSTIKVAGINTISNDNVASALEVSGTLTTSTVNECSINGYAIGANSKSTVVVKNGGKFSLTKDATTLSAKAVANADSATVFELERGGNFQAGNLSVVGNTFNANRATVLLDGNTTIRGSLSLDASSYARVDITGGSVSAASLTVRGSQTATDNKGAIVNITGGTTTVGNATIVGISAINVSGGTLNATDGLSISSYGTMTVSGTGKLNVLGGVVAFYDNNVNAGLVVNTAGNVVNGSFFLPEFANVRVGADNSWTNSNMLFRGSRNGLTLTAGTLEIKGLLFVSDLQKSVTLSVAEGALLKVASIDGSENYLDKDYIGLGQLSLNSTLNITAFYEKTILFGELGDDADVQNFLNRIMIAGVVDKNLAFSDFDSVAGGYWLTNVPEPAEWAAIFGAFALAFAVYRRRK